MFWALATSTLLIPALLYLSVWWDRPVRFSPIYCKKPIANRVSCRTAAATAGTWMRSITGCLLMTRRRSPSVLEKLNGLASELVIVGCNVLQCPIRSAILQRWSVIAIWVFVTQTDFDQRRESYPGGLGLRWRILERYETRMWGEKTQIANCALFRFNK